MSAPSEPDWILGNDVVDLGDPDSRGVLKNRPFLDRVFVPAERELLANVIEGELEPGQAERLAWALWAGKEAAYKALLAARNDLIWSPRRFVVRLDRSGNLSPAGLAPGSLSGLVGHEAGDCVHFSCEFAPGLVHAVCFGKREATGRYAVPPPGSRDIPRPVSAVESLPAGADESTAVRELAVRLLQKEKGGAAPRIEGDLPRFYGAAGRLELPLSLSHHGSYVAAALLPLD